MRFLRFKHFALTAIFCSLLPHLSHAACPALSDIETYQKTEAGDYAYLIGPFNGWMFRTRGDLKQNFPLKPETKDALRRLHQALQSKNIQLLAFPIPSKAMAHNEMLGRDVKYDAVDALRNYHGLLSEIGETGLLTPDMTELEAVEEFYWREDSHWNSDGARFSAQRIADRLMSDPDFNLISSVKFTTKEETAAPPKSLGYLDFYNENCEEKLVAAPAGKSFVTERAETANSEEDLFSDKVAPEITLLGTSNSTTPGPSFANFEGFLKQFTQRDIRNEAIAGGGLSGSILNYILSDNFKSNPAKFLIWEFPAHNSLNNESFLREIVPAVYGACPASDIIYKSSAVFSNRKTMLFSDLEKFNLSSSKFYLALNFRGDAPRHVKINFDYGDNILDAVSLNRPLRSFSKNDGRYFAEFGDKDGKPVKNLSVTAKDFLGELEAVICKAPDQNLPLEKTAPKEKNKIVATILNLQEKLTIFQEGERYKFLPAKKSSHAALPILLKADAYSAEIIPPVAAGKIFVGLASTENLAGRMASFPNAEKQSNPILIYNGHYDLHTLREEINDDTLLQETEGAYILRAPLILFPGASLILKQLAKPILLSQSYGAYISSAGNLFIEDSAIFGWDERHNKAAKLNPFNDNFRPFITIWDGGRLYASKARFKNLGFDSSNASGISLISDPELQNRFYNETGHALGRPYAHIFSSWIEDAYTGFYMDDAGEVAILESSITKSGFHGISLKGDAASLVISKNSIALSQGHGISVAGNTMGGFIIGNQINENAKSGLYLGQDSGNMVIALNAVEFNKGDGITAHKSVSHKIYSNSFKYNEKAGLRIKSSDRIDARNNVAQFNKDFAAIISGPGQGHDISHLEVIGNKGFLKTEKAEALLFTMPQASNQLPRFGGDIDKSADDLKENIYIQLNAIDKEKMK